MSIDLRKSLRVCCYGSSSPSTPQKYLDEAYEVGYLLGSRGHTCVNGAGSSGCMMSMNDGASDANGHIVGVIHEKFVVDGNDWISNCGAHGVFAKSSSNNQDGPHREIMIARGEDLQERKRMLVKGADALIVLPGGPGTFDELWEMACARNIGMTNIPIVCVNVDGYYEPFRQMLQRASLDKLNKLEPDEIIHFEPTAQAAVSWVENYKGSRRAILKSRKAVLKTQPQSFMSPLNFLESFDFSKDDNSEDDSESSLNVSSPEDMKVYSKQDQIGDESLFVPATALVLGIAIGIALSSDLSPLSL